MLDETGVVARPWLTVIIDDRSRAVAAYRLWICFKALSRTALCDPYDDPWSGVRSVAWFLTDAQIAVRVPFWHMLVR